MSLSSSLIAVAAPSGVLFADELPPPVKLLVGRSAVIDVGTPISRVVADQRRRRRRDGHLGNQLLINGKMPGTISMFVWERAGALRQLRDQSCSATSRGSTNR